MAKKVSKSLSFADLKKRTEKSLGENTFKSGAEFLEDSIEFVSTGILPLDIMTGGGFPKGRIIDLYGDYGSGKCVPLDVNVWTDLGLMTVREIFDYFGVVKDTLVTETEVSAELLNGYGNVESTTVFTTNGEQEVWELTTSDGRRVRSTGNHPHYVNGSFVDDSGMWVNTEEIKQGDRFQVPGVDMRSKPQRCWYDFTVEQAYVLGAMTTRGFLGSQGEPTLTLNTLTYSEDTPLETFFTQPGLNGMDLEPVSHVGSEDYTYGGKFANVGNFYRALGTLPSTPQDRIIPLNIRLNSSEIIAAYLAGFIESHGVWQENGDLTLTVESKNLAEQTQLLFAGYGINATISDEPFFRQVGLAQYCIRIADEYNEALQSALPSFFEGFYPTPVGPQKEASFDATETTVVAIKSLGDKPTFDFTMEETHTFLLNGVVTHNTGIALSALANAQKEGPCVYIDLEKAFDPGLAKLVGVDLDALEYVRIQSAEDCLNFVIDAVNTNEVPLIIIDSIAGLVPRALLEGEIGDAIVGKTQQYVSQAASVLAKSDSDTVIVGINQLRAKIGGGGFAFGPQSYATGGKAWKFYASQRLNVARIGSVKSGDAIIGHKVNIKGDKVRMAMPFQTAAFDVIYGVGVDNEGFVLDAAEELGFVKRSGSWYTDTRTGESLGQGKLKVTEMLREDRETYNSLKNAVMAEITGDALGGEDVEVADYD